MNPLQEKLKVLTGNKRNFILLRVAGLDVDFCKRLVSVTRGTYNSWFKNEDFAGLYHELPTLMQEYRFEAVQLLRRQNQLDAVLLEGKIITKIKEEIDNGQLVLTRTHLAREVYSKLMTDLDIIPEVKVFTWTDRINQLPFNQPKELPEGETGGETIDGEFSEVSSLKT